MGSTLSAIHNLDLVGHIHCSFLHRRVYDIYARSLEYCNLCFDIFQPAVHPHRVFRPQILGEDEDHPASGNSNSAFHRKLAQKSRAGT